MGLSWVISSELRKSRLHDRLRLALLDLLSLDDDEEDSTNIAPSKAPTSGQVFSITESIKKPTIEKKSDKSGVTETTSNVTTLLSTGTALTSSLWVATIRIPPNHEMKLHKANGLEFYYVLQGYGEWGSKANDSSSEVESQQTSPISPGDALIIDPNSMRWIANTSRLENLVLLRTSDAGYSYSQKGYDRILQITSNSIRDSANRLLSSGASKMGGFVKSLIGGNSSSSSKIT